jgi:hypothetical protein
MHYVSYGSWLCENAKLLDDDRRSYSSKTALGHQLAIAFNFKIELKNVILVAFRTFAFLHSQGHSRHFAGLPITSGLPLEADIVRAGGHVSGCHEPPSAPANAHHHQLVSLCQLEHDVPWVKA